MRHALALALSLLVAGTALAQGSPGGSALDDQQRLLDLKAAWVTMNNARSERDRARALYADALVSESELGSAEAAYQVAQVAYQQRFLQLFAATPRVSVERCVKSYEGEGRQYVTVTLRNASAPALDYRSVGIVDDEVPLPDMERLREVANVVAALTDESGTVISSPYERTVASIAPEGTSSLRFQLLRDVDVVRVALRYAGRIETLPVYLEKDAAANVVRMQSRQFSQEADLGSSALYDLRMERYGVSGGVFSLRVFGLPDEVGAEFIDPSTGARLTQIKFTEGANSQQLQLRVFLPDVVSARVAMDTPLEFWAAALDRGRSEALPAGRALSEAQIDAVRASAARLELVPRGVGKLEVTAPSLFRQIRQGQRASLDVTVRNIGTRRADNVRLQADAPPDWRVTVEPALVERIETGAEVSIHLLLEPPEAVQVGDFPIRLRTEAYADNRRIDSSDQTARIQVDAPPNTMAIVLLGLVLFGLVGGLVVWGVRLTRR